MALSVEQRVLLHLRPQLIHHLHPFTDIIANRLRTLGLFTEINEAANFNVELHINATMPISA